MSNSEDLAALLAAAKADLTDPERNFVVRGREGEAPRFELFHAGLSVCSEKVRATLAEKGVPYGSHEMVILNSRGVYSKELTPAENYRPSYARLRLYGGKQAGLDLIDGYSGRSSVTTEGFDPCVVPTLVDIEKANVIVDSKRICAYLDAELPGSLIPADASAAEAVMEQVSIVDTTPQPALLYGYHPDDDQRPDFVKEVMKNVYDIKIEALEMLLEQNSDDPDLVAAYRSKIAKEAKGKTVYRDEAKQLAYREETRGILNQLDKQLEQHANPWVCGAEFTMADLVWAINLYRLKWLGLAKLWEDLPRVEEYARRVYKRPSIWEDVINFPSPMPESPHTADVKESA